MDHEPGARENPSPPDENVGEQQEHFESTEISSVDELPTRLGFIESPQMVAARREWMEAIQLGAEGASGLAIEYQDLAERAEINQNARVMQARSNVLDWITNQHQSPDGESVLPEAAENGFIETEQMRLIRARIAVIMSEPSGEEPPTELAEQLEAYNHQADKLESAAGGKFRIGLMIAKAIVWRDAGKEEFFQEDMDDVLAFAMGMQTSHGAPFDEIVSRLT
jgi:hypothetical protein